VIFLRKIIVVALAVFVRDAFFQVFLSALCIVGFLIAHILVKPFVPPEALGSPTMSTGNVMKISAASIPPHGLNKISVFPHMAWHGMDEMNVLESLSLSTTFITMMGCTSCCSNVLNRHVGDCDIVCLCAGRQACCTGGILSTTPRLL
jgi:hypothetical protein